MAMVNGPAARNTSRIGFTAMSLASPKVTPLASIRAPAPQLGEHNRALLAGVGVDAPEYAKLLAAGIVCEGGAAPKGEEE